MNKLIKRNILIGIAFLFILFFRFLPVPEGLNTSAFQVLGIFAGVLLLWLTIAIDWPSLLAIAALAFVPELEVNSILASSMGGATFSFLIFTFMCTHALSKTTFIRRVALAFINSNIAKKGPWWFAIQFFTSAIVLGAFMSPTVLFVIYLPIHDEICKVLGLKKTDSYANMLMMGMTLSIAIACGMTPIAHVFSIMALGFYEAATGMTINYLHFIAFGVSVGVVCYAFLLLLFRFVLRPDVSVFEANRNEYLKNNMAVMDRKETMILSIFIAVVVLWIAPGFLEFFLPSVADFIDSFGIAIPPLLGALAMMIITVDGKPLLEFNDAMKNGISWGAVIMTASTLALGAAMTNESIGITAWLQSTLEPMLGNLPVMLLVFFFTAWAALQTNLSSNLVTVTVVSAVALPIAIATNGALSTPAIASMIGLMGAYAFATPPAHPNVALAIGSGWTSTTQMLFYGGILMAFSIVATTFIGYPIASALMGQF